MFPDACDYQEFLNKFSLGYYRVLTAEEYKEIIEGMISYNEDSVSKEDYDQEIYEKDTEIERLGDKIKDLEDKIEDYEKLVDKLEDEMDELQDEIRSLNKQIEELEE